MSRFNSSIQKLQWFLAWVTAVRFLQFIRDCHWSGYSGRDPLGHDEERRIAMDVAMEWRWRAFCQLPGCTGTGSCEDPEVLPIFASKMINRYKFDINSRTEFEWHKWHNSFPSKWTKWTWQVMITSPKGLALAPAQLARLSWWARGFSSWLCSLVQWPSIERRGYV